MASFTVHLDRRYQVTGVHSAGTTTWTLPIADAAVNCVVIGEGGSSNVGTTFTGNQVTVSGKNVSVSGNYGGYESIVGVLFDVQVDLSPPFPVTNQQNPEIAAWRQIRHVDLAYHRSAGFTVESSMSGRATRTWTLPDPSDGQAEGSGTFRARCNGSADLQTISIKSTSPKRICVDAAKFEMDVNTRRD